jgi:NAD+ kinase
MAQQQTQHALARSQDQFMQQNGNSLAHLEASKLRIACVHSGSDLAEIHFNELSAEFSFVPPQQSDVILALGGDGLMLHALHTHMELNKPIYGMHCGTIGFLMNDYSKDQLVERILSADLFELHPVAMKATTTEGKVEQALAFNEVALIRGSAQSANIRVSVDGVVRLEKYMGDGLIVSTAAGSTAYNLSAHGPIIPLGANLLALTPVSPFRPRRWKGALLPRASVITLENLDPRKRPLLTTADSKDIYDVVTVSVREDQSHSVKMLFDKDHSLEERIMREQFTA